MKQALGWWWPDNEQHLLDWMMNPKGATTINGRRAYQGKKQLAAIAQVPADRRRTAIDVGGHVGLWSWNLAHWFDAVEAFEPVALHRECWQANMAPMLEVAAPGEVTLHPYALGEREDTIAIHTANTSSGDSWVKGKGTIPMKLLDSFGFENVDFIKIDCEGYEEFVLRGAKLTIQEWKPVICVEQKRDMAAKKFGLETLGAVKLLQAWGYKVAQEISGDYIMVPG